MKDPRFNRRILIAGTLASVVLGGCRKQRARPLSFSLPWGEASFHTSNARTFASKVGEKTAGRVDIRVFSGASLGVKGPQSIRALQENIVNLADISGFQQVGTAPVLGLESLPLLIDSMEELELLWSRLRNIVDRKLSTLGLKVLYVVPWPQQNIFSKTEIRQPSDLYGLRIRSQAPIMTAFSRALGMAPIQLTNPETVPALATGMIDAVATSTSTASSQKYWEFLGYTLRTNHLWSSNIVAINRGAWERIAKEDRDVIQEIADTLEEQFWQISREEDLRQLKRLEAMGMKTTMPTREFIKRMRAAARPLWRDFALALAPEEKEVLQWFIEAVQRGS
ncbi:TRAP transporter substrate-binding protein [Lentisalinibacter orientalis]|uniref:TRAP transporter substrate-binding protein n=1 Tax=Lentisalinibacter orientalis TaxID=2992241 RepID=UPI003869635A